MGLDYQAFCCFFQYRLELSEVLPEWLQSKQGKTGNSLETFCSEISAGSEILKHVGASDL